MTSSADPSEPVLLMQLRRTLLGSAIQAARLGQADTLASAVHAYCAILHATAQPGVVGAGIAVESNGLYPEGG